MAIGETIVGSLLQVLFDKLISQGLDVVQRKGISTTQLNKWKRMLVTVNAVLDDAEDKQLSGNRLVKLWLDDVRDLAYDLEDLLDDFAAEATQAKSEAKSSTSSGQVKRKFSFFGQDESSRSNPNPCVRLSETKVEEINDRLKEIVARKDCLSLRKNAVDRSNYTNKRLPSTSLPEPQFFGRENEEAEILDLLTSEAENDTMLSIVPIVGMGGVGKTALAQRLFYNDRVIRCFESRAWVCVSDVFDVLDITKNILQLITGLSCEGKDLNWIQVKLKNSLSGKKFLVVLDDVWNEKYGEWTALLKPFEAGAKGSKIIITTRNLYVVSITGASPYPLEVLSLDNCTSLLACHALGATDFKRDPNLETVGKKIAEKCKGLPLAAKILGGLLRNKRNYVEWEAILKNRMWDLPTGENGEILPILKLSYVHLPSYLKRCFAYCAVFPKDYEIERDELILLWIVEGFLDGRKAKENILRLGRSYFDELVSRSFLQQSSVDSSRFSMHDLLNDLAKSIAGGTCFSSGESQLASNGDDASLEKSRYASFISPRFATSKSLRAYKGMKVLRSLMLLPIGSGRGSEKFSISNKVLHDLLTKLKYLRVFSLCHCSIIEVPNCVVDLNHLRYLNFSYTNIERLPESIGTLCNLQALILRGCQKLSMLPPSITKLISLQFLDIRDTWSLKEMPLGISHLKNLIVLSKFVIGSEKGSRLKELKNLPHLQGELLISKLEKVKEVREAIDANLFGKQGLSNLFLHWVEDFGNHPNDEHEARVLQSLRPHTNLENLTISNYRGAVFPSWLDSLSYFKITSLCLCGCPNVISLPSIGQLPSLRKLSLEGLQAVSMIGSEFYGTNRPFSSLTTMKFEHMLAWKDWSHYAGGREEVPFSCLQHLVVDSCPAFVGTFPCQLDHLIKLEIWSCPNLNISTSAVCLPSLHELYLGNCNKELLKGLVNLTSLTILTINNLPKLVCFDQGFMSYLVKLKELHIINCDKLTYLWQDVNETQNVICLQELYIRSCPRFTYFVAGVEELELPCNLERMELTDCVSLEKLSSKMHTLSSLKHLRIDNCPKLMGRTIFPNDSSSNNPKSQLAALKILNISGCKGVESLEKIIGESLEHIGIVNCENLRSLPRCLHRLSHLTHLELYNCPAVEYFPPLPITLSFFSLINCPKIKSLPNQWHHLTSLLTLKIRSCQNIKCFPIGGLPPNLRELRISGCENLKQPVREWDLHMLTSLEHLEIDCSMGGDGEKVWFPSEDEDAWSLLFPSSLTSLELTKMSNMERLSSGLRNHLSSLKQLSFADCPKLRDLPEDGLPPSLQVLNIHGCKILEDRCSKLTGDCWPLIQEIPFILIEYVRIQ